MKRIFFQIAVLLILFMSPSLISAQTPPHPNGGNAPGSGNTPVGGGAPIDGGLTLLIALGTIYGTRRAIYYKK